MKKIMIQMSALKLYNLSKEKLFFKGKTTQKIKIHFQKKRIYQVLKGVGLKLSKKD